MTRPARRVASDPVRWPTPCSACGQHLETRPYGAGGARVCFRCAMATPEAAATARAIFAAATDGPAPRVLTDEGPQRLPENLTGPGKN